MAKSKSSPEAKVEPELQDDNLETFDVFTSDGVDVSSQDGMSVEEQFLQANTELEVMRQQLLRSQADFDNFRKRTRQEKEDLQKFSNKKILQDLLAVADNFDRALEAFVDDSGPAEIKAGIDMVYRQLLQVLTQYGVVVMEVVGKPFDPNLHAGVMQEPAGDEEAGLITRELQKGYLLHDKVLRPAMVAVTV